METIVFESKLKLIDGIDLIELLGGENRKIKSNIVGLDIPAPQANGVDRK